jgi:hypothetical protein
VKEAEQDSKLNMEVTIEYIRNLKKLYGPKANESCLNEKRSNSGYYSYQQK